MKKTLKRVLCALVCLAMLFSSVIPVISYGLQIGTNVNIKIESIRITSKTEDCAIKVGDDLNLYVLFSQSISSYKWEVSADGGVNWTQVGYDSGASWTDTVDSASYTIDSAKLNAPENVPYQYRCSALTSTNSAASAIINVLVSDDYAYRTISLRNGETYASAYMHDSTRLVVTPLDENSAAAVELKKKLTSNCLPLIICDISLVNQNNEVLPYFGKLQIDFHVGSSYDGQPLNVYHLLGENVITYSGTVSDGILSVTVNSLSPFMVEVQDADTNTVTVNVGAGGSVVPSGKVNVADGSDKTLTFLPNAGYEISAVTVDYIPVVFSGNSYTLTNVTEDKTVFVSFQKVAPTEAIHNVNINSPAHGSVYPSGEIKVRQGSAQVISFYPDRGFELDTVSVNGTIVNVIGNSYTLSAVKEDTDVRVSFREGLSQPPNVYKTIFTSAGANGSISPMGDVRVEYGGNMYFYFIPNEGYEVDKVTVDGEEEPVAGFYHLINVVDAHTINVSFKPKTDPPSPVPTPNPSSPSRIFRPITAESGANGKISPSGNIYVADGGSQTFSFIPDKGYVVDTVKVDGKPVNVSGNSYSFSGIGSSHSIMVTFKKAAATEAADPAKYYTIISDSGENGKINPDGEIKIAGGKNAYFYFIPDEGYETDIVTVDGEQISTDGNSYCFEDADADHTINVTFKKSSSETTVYHTVAVSADGGGSISPSGEVQIPEGGSQTFYLIANEGFETEAIYVDGVKQDFVGGQFTVDNISADMEIYAVFMPIETGGDHCLICYLVGSNIAPWCIIIPIALVCAIGGILWFSLRKRKK